MTLYFDYRVNIGEINVSYSCFDWHPQHGLLAVATYNQERGGAVYICDELGDKLTDVEPGIHPVSEVTCLSWHPGRKTLVITWKNGDIRVWNDSDSEFTLVPSTRQSPVKAAKWSTQGTRFLTIDANGEIGGWRLDARGQLVSLFWLRLETGIPVLIENRKHSVIAADYVPKTPGAGDERARDVFSSWRPRTAGRRTTMMTDNVAFYVSSDKGSVFLVSESGTLEEVLSSLGNIQSLLYHDKDDYLLVMTEGFNMSYYSVDPDGSLLEMTKVKLSGSGQVCAITWVGDGLLACAVGDLTIRFWEPSTGDSFSTKIIDNEGTNPLNSTKEMISNLVYSPLIGLLVACTNIGSVAFWRKGVDGWVQTAINKIKQGVKNASWGPNLLAVNTTSSVLVFKEHNLSAAYNPQVSVVQTSASQLVLRSGDDTSELNTDLQVCGVTLGKETLALWSGKVVAIYQILPLTSVNVIGSFSCECTSAGIWEQSVVVLLNSGKVEVLTLQGTIKQSIDTDGQAITLHLNGPYLTVANINGMLQVWDVSRREPKPVTKVKDMVDTLDDFGEVMIAQANSNATCVAITAADSNLTPLPVIFVWNVENDVLYSYNYSSTENVDLRFVINIAWDIEEPRLLVCEAKRPTPSVKAKKIIVDPNDPMNILSSFIISSSHGLLLRESIPMGENFVSLLAFDIPKFITLEKSKIPQKVNVEKLIMKEFEGLEDCDTTTKNAVINFSISLIVNDVDQAFKAIRNVNSVAVWAGLARMCVKGKRLDVARVCLGHMKHTRGVMALNEAMKEPEEEARLAALALQLNMNDEAEKLYKQCNRFDLLNKMYQRCDKWDQAIELSEKLDRIHLRNTYHNYARQLEEQGNIEVAMQMYYKAETHRHEVPRMLLSDTAALEKYISNSKDPSLLKWWAQYIESTGNMEAAMKYYQDAGDQLSMVRVMCYLEDFDKAAVIADTSGDKAACYHLARALENVGRLQEAIHFFTRATAYANAIRMCKEQGLDDQLWALALSAGPREQVEVAKYIEVTSPERAVLLYHRAGLLHRAVDLAFRNNLYDAIEIIATELTPDSDRELLIKCADFFMEQKHFEKAVHLLAIAQQFADAITICWEHNVILNEELAEKLTPGPSVEDRIILIETLGDCALAQANYHLATKKYTQAGNKMKAMKALLKSGDTEKIIFFANVSRQKEMYVMAGNYLQSLDWQARPDLLKTIITFYTKGKAPHLLANFYMACAQVEVDDYGNYEKALGALNEALRCLGKNSDQFSNISEAVTRKIALVNRFLEIKRLFERGDTEAGMTSCKQLLGMAGELVRRGDIYALMVEEAAKKGDWGRAKQLALELRQAQPADNLAFYLHQDLLSRLGLQDAVTQKEQTSVDYEDDIVEDETVGTSF